MLILQRMLLQRKLHLQQWLLPRKLRRSLLQLLPQLLLLLRLDLCRLLLRLT
jgi:hypothetical protein